MSDELAQLAQLRTDKAELAAALRDCIESLRRLPDTDGAFRITCIQQAERAIEGHRFTTTDKIELIEGLKAIKDHHNFTEEWRDIARNLVSKHSNL